MGIDITKIAGYTEGMTAEEKLALLDNFEIPAADHTGYIKKETFDKTASDLAKAKADLKLKMTEDEQKEAERAAHEAEREARIAELEKKEAMSSLKAKYLAIGYDEALAEDTAKAHADNDWDKVFKNQNAHLENVKKAERASALAGNPKPPAGQGKEINEKDKLIAQYNEAEKAKNVFLMQSILQKIKNIKQE